MSQRTCRECRTVFECFDAFFVERGLTLPTRCRWCREARRRERLQGTVIKFFPTRGYGFLMTDDTAAETFFFSVSDQGAATFEVYIGQRLEFWPQRHTGPHPRARRLAAVVVGDGEGSR